jgi:hypothetical protein
MSCPLDWQLSITSRSRRSDITASGVENACFWLLPDESTGRFSEQLSNWAVTTSTGGAGTRFGSKRSRRDLPRAYRTALVRHREGNSHSLPLIFLLNEATCIKVSALNSWSCAQQ